MSMRCNYNLRSYYKRCGRSDDDDGCANEVLNRFQRALETNDVQELDSMISPGNQILSATSSVLKTTALHITCESQSVNIDVLQALIDKGANIDAQTIEGNTPLYTAVTSVRYSESTSYSNHIDAIKILLKRGANPSIKSVRGLTPIQAALDLYHMQVVEAFLKDEDKLPDIMEVEKRIRLRHLIKCLVKENEVLTLSDTNYSLGLQFLLFQNDVESFDDDLFEYLAKETRFDVNAFNNDGFTLMQYVAQFGTPRCIQVLIDLGADLGAFYGYAQPPIFSAISYNRLYNVQFFLDYSASVDIQNYSNLRVSAFHYAIQCGRFEIVKLLVENGVNVNELINQHSPLQIACAYNRNNVEIVEFLLASGADVNRTNELDMSVLDECCENPAFEIVKLLLSYGAKLDLGNISTLHYAAKGGNPDIIRLLLQLGADVNYECNVVPLIDCHYDKRYLDIRFTPLQYASYEHTKYMVDDYSMIDFNPGLKVLVAFVVKLIARKELVKEENLKLLQKTPIFVIYRECMDEVNKMNMNVCESLNFSFLSILTRDIDALGRVLKNKDFLQGLHVGQYKLEFPIYARDLEQRILEAQLRYPKVELVSQFFEKHVVRRNFYDNFVYICTYLNFKDLENLGEAVK